MMTKKSLLSLLVAATLTGTVAFSYVYADDSTDSTQVESTDDVQKFDDPQRLEDTLIGWQEERKTIAEQDLQDAEDALAANEDPDKEEDLQKAVDAAQEELDAIAKSIEDLPGLVEQLTEEQLFALNRSLNNATNNGLIVDLNSEYMEMLIDGEYNKQQINALTRQAVGPYAQPFVSEALDKGSNVEPVGPDYALPATQTYFSNRKISIYGGSNEVQRQIIAKSILEL